MMEKNHVFTFTEHRYYIWHRIVMDQKQEHTHSWKCVVSLQKYNINKIIATTALATANNNTKQ